MTNSNTQTFNISHARQIGSRVAADLQRFKRLYLAPTDQQIADYEGELVELLQHDVVKEVVYGFQRNGQWTEASVKYKALPGGELGTSDDPGKIRPNLDVANATFKSFLTYNDKWDAMSQVQRDAINAASPIKRSTTTTPTLEVGYWADDNSYTAGGRGLGRSSAKK